MHSPACHHPASVTHAFSSVATIHFIFSELGNQELLHPVFSLQIKKLRPEKGSDITKINSLIQDSSLTQQWLDLVRTTTLPAHPHPHPPPKREDPFVFKSWNETLNFIYVNHAKSTLYYSISRERGGRTVFQQTLHISFRMEPKPHSIRESYNTEALPALPPPLSLFMWLRGKVEVSGPWSKKSPSL